jgi:glutathione peroxidase
MRSIFLIISYIFSALFVNRNKALNTNTTPMTANKSLYDFTMTSLEGQSVPLSTYKGKVVVIINVASKCGYTPQYAELEKFYEANKDRGVVLLGFPANNFGAQEPGSNSEIRQFCTRNYGVSFPMFSKISVEGSDIHPLYKFLTTKSENGVGDSRVKWNFQKYIIDKNGRLVGHFDSGVKVTDKGFVETIEKLIKN